MSAKVSSFSPAGALTGTEIIGLVRGGANVRSTVADVAAAASGQASDVTLNLTSSLVPSGVGTNDASAINALIAALPTGGVVQFPAGHYLFNGKIDLANRTTARGHGPGTENGGATTNTLLTFPPGSTGFRLHHFQGQNSRVEDLGVEQSAALTTSVTASYTYNAASTNQTMTLSAAGDFQNGQVVQLDGAGMDVVIAGRLFTTNAGSPVVTWVETDGIFRGNSPGYNGMEIAIAGAGFAPGTTIVSWGIGTATLSGNAANSVAGVFATITTPLITEIISGGGSTTLTFADIPYTGGKNVTSRKLSHCAPGIYSSISCHTRNFQAFNSQAGMVINGITTGAAVADNGTFFNSHFGGGGSKFGVVLQGSDAQVNSFFACNFAGPEIGVLDQSFLGNYFYGCHWAFNMGLLVAGNGANTQIHGGYMESGTSWVVNNSGSSNFYGTESMVPGYGLNGFGYIGADWVSSGIILRGPVVATDAAFSSSLYAGGGKPAYFTGNLNGVPDGPGTTSGIALGNSIGSGFGGINVLVSLDNPATFSMRELSVEASTFRFGNSYLGSQFGTLNATAFDHPAAFRVNGSQVVGARGASLPADATDLATALTLLNAIKARMKVTGGHGLVAD